MGCENRSGESECEEGGGDAMRWDGMGWEEEEKKEEEEEEEEKEEQEEEEEEKKKDLWREV